MFDWTHHVDYPLDWDECDGYRVFWEYPGYERNKVWFAENPLKLRVKFASKHEAMAFCEKGIMRRREQAENERREESGELAEMKARGRAQIAAMKEMMRG